MVTLIVTRHPQLFLGSILVAFLVPPWGSPRLVQWRSLRLRHQRGLESNEYASTCQSEALVHVGLFAQWLVQSCRVALSMSGALSLCVMAKMGISTLRSCKGARIADASGLNKDVVYMCFDGISSQIERKNFKQMALRCPSVHERGSPSLPSGVSLCFNRRGFSAPWTIAKFRKLHPASSQSGLPFMQASSSESLLSHVWLYHVCLSGHRFFLHFGNLTPHCHVVHRLRTCGTKWSSVM